MASSRSAQARSRPARRAPAQRPRQRPRAVGGGAAARAAGIRWDRVGRVVLLVVLVGLLGLYVGPARSYLGARHEAGQRSAEVTELRRENRRLRERRAALGDPQALEREARRLGMVKPGEKSYVIEHLPRGR
jgi:cell division protein FtsB